MFLCMAKQGECNNNRNEFNTLCTRREKLQCKAKVDNSWQGKERVKGVGQIRVCPINLDQGHVQMKS